MKAFTTVVPTRLPYTHDLHKGVEYRWYKSETSTCMMIIVKVAKLLLLLSAKADNHAGFLSFLPSNDQQAYDFSRTLT